MIESARGIFKWRCWFLHLYINANTFWRSAPFPSLDEGVHSPFSYSSSAWLSHGGRLYSRHFTFVILFHQSPTPHCEIVNSISILQIKKAGLTKDRWLVCSQTNSRAKNQIRVCLALESMRTPFNYLHSNTVILKWRQFCPPAAIQQCLEIFLIGKEY